VREFDSETQTQLRMLSRGTCHPGNSDSRICPFECSFEAHTTLSEGVDQSPSSSELTAAIIAAADVEAPMVRPRRCPENCSSQIARRFATITAQVHDSKSGAILISPTHSRSGSKLGEKKRASEPS
jgi:hypothetical protein